MFFRSMAAILVAFCSAIPAAAQTPEPQFTLVSDVQFCTGGGSPLLMDILIPKHPVATPTPAVLWIHGGGWDHGDKNAHSNAAFFAEGGFIAATLSYRLSDQAPFPAAIEDSKCAIRFLRANAAKYGIDPDRIGVAGSSAGGHLAELVATASPSAGLEGDGGWQEVSSKVQAVASYYGPTDLTKPFPQDTVPVIVKFLQGTEKEKPELYRKASPIFYVSKDDPPLLLVHGEQDKDVPLDQSARMDKAYRHAGLPVEFIKVENAGHDFQHIGEGPITPSVEVIHQKTVEFFKRYLTSVSTAAMKEQIGERGAPRALDIRNKFDHTAIMKMIDFPMAVTDWSQVEPSEHPGNHGVAVWRTQMCGEIRVRMVEYTPGYVADHWCDKGHVVLCLAGSLDIELRDGKRLSLAPGQSYQVGDGDPPHRSATVAGAKLFIVD